MKKHKNTYQWLWKWHFIGGIIALPFIIILAVTGIIYLFKDAYEKPIYKDVKEVSIGNERVSYDRQWELAKESAVAPPHTMLLPQTNNEATEFVSGRFARESSIYIDPYKNLVTNEIISSETDMFQVRKLHGELLTGKFGTKIVELVASWMVVLLLSGLYLFWPRNNGGGIKSFFRIRRNGNKRIFYRDLHAVMGFWSSLLILLILAGGLPWTDIFGNNFAWLQKKTNAGYPKEWNGQFFESTPIGVPLSLDDMAEIANKENLTGEVGITLPQNPTAVFSVSNTTPDLSHRKMIHFDQYSGKMVKELSWKDVGPMIQGRMWVMEFHQGHFGWWNWLLVLFTAIGILVLSIAALISYIKRKKRGSWSIPRTSKDLKVGKGVIISIILLGIILPLFGLSIIVISLWEWMSTSYNKSK
ncbi:PepSY-associated TM helix domain-containing protein [Membranihabitans maritimus]|uniref:PepSY-associated TM helix domain-containing protein n=1 Tax=Membranihabitans maritimus TaxID=2904244 RepID=UPI001F3750E8|nr:PepSY domain-containing protein [Membranihabitans maritimus]